MQPRLNDLGSVRIPVRLQFQNPQQFAGNMLSMIECWQNPHPLRQMQAQALASGLAVTILQDHADTGMKETESASSLDFLPSYLSRHLNESVSVEEMARLAHIYPSPDSATCFGTNSACRRTNTCSSCASSMPKSCC